MNRRPGPLPSQLERALSDVGTKIQVPRAPDLAASVRSRLESQTARRGPIPAPRLALVAAVLLIAVLGGAFLFSSSAREAVAGWLGIRGVDIVEDAPTPAPTHPDAGLPLGRRSSLEEARKLVPFEIALPAAPGLGRPDEVYVAETAYGGRSVSLVYRADHSLPSAAGTGVGLLVTEFEAGLRDDLMQKVRTAGVEVEPVRVGTSSAYWISGEPHLVLLLDPSGNVIEDRTRLAGDTLLWERGRVSLRLESGLGKGWALRIARSMLAP